MSETTTQAASRFVKGSAEGLENLPAMAASMILPTLAAWEADRKALHTKSETVSDSRLVELANTSGDDADKANAKLLTDLKAKIKEVTDALRTSLAPGTADAIDKKVVAERVRSARQQIEASVNILPEADRQGYSEWLAAQGYSAATAEKVTRPRVSSIVLSGAASGKAGTFTEAANLIQAQSGTAVQVNVLKNRWTETAGKSHDQITEDVSFTLDLGEGKSVDVTVVPKVAAE